MSNLLDATAAKRFDIRVKQNQTFNPVMTFTDANGASLDLTGVEIKLSVRQAGCNNNCGCIGETEFDLTFKQDFTGHVIGGDTVTFNDIIHLDTGIYKYDMLVVYPSGIQKYLLTGSFKVKRSYTNI